MLVSCEANEQLWQKKLSDLQARISEILTVKPSIFRTSGEVLAVIQYWFLRDMVMSNFSKCLSSYGVPTAV